MIIFNFVTMKFETWDTFLCSLQLGQSNKNFQKLKTSYYFSHSTFEHINYTKNKNVCSLIWIQMIENSSQIHQYIFHHGLNPWKRDLT